MSSSFCLGADYPSYIPCLAKGRETKDTLSLSLSLVSPEEGGAAQLIGPRWG